MKLTLLFSPLLFLLLFLSCGSTPKEEGLNYEISGSILNASGQPVYLEEIYFNKNRPVDTAIIAGDGSFQLKGSLKTPGLYMIKVNPNYQYLVPLEGKKITIEADLKNVQDYKIEGSSQAVSSRGLIRIISAGQMKLQQLNNEFNQSMLQNDQAKLLSIQQAYGQETKAYTQSIKSFIDTSSFPLLKMFASGFLNMEQEYQYLEPLYTDLKKQIPSAPMFIELDKQFQVQTKLAIGRTVPSFSLKNPTGGVIGLESAKGEVILLDFWASWCKPCRAENPNLVNTYAKYKAKGFDVISISLDNNLQQWVNAIQMDKLTWESHGSNLLGWKCPVAQSFNVSSIPATFLVNKEGKILAKNLRGMELDNKLAEIFGN